MCILVGKDVNSVALGVVLDASTNSLSGGVALCRGGIRGGLYAVWFKTISWPRYFGNLWQGRMHGSVLEQVTQWV